MLISIVIPTYKRVAQTLTTLSLILDSQINIPNCSLEIIISDGSPDFELKDEIDKRFGDKVRYSRPAASGISQAKNNGAKISKGSILIFCDSDIEVEKNTIQNTLRFFHEQTLAAAVTGAVIWKGGPQNGKNDRPRKEDRILNIENVEYVEAIYSRYFATYKKVFFEVGGYDEEVFSMRGEGSDLSIRYWRKGYPLAYDPSIIVHHLYDAPDSIALRVPHPEFGIAKDLLKLSYKYGMLLGDYENLNSTISANFAQFGKNNFLRLIQGIGNNISEITEDITKINQEMKNMTFDYDFKFLEIFSDEKKARECIKNSEKKLLEVRNSSGIF